MKMIFDDALLHNDGVWLVSVPPHQIPTLGIPKANRGMRSVLLVENPKFTASQSTITADLSSILVLNQGTTSDTLIIDALTTHEEPKTVSKKHEDTAFGPGDNEYLELARRELRGEALEAAIQILTKVRKIYPGDLKRGERNKFVDTPDNFWTITIQPRIQELAITVRGYPSKFLPTNLEPKDDRPGYTRFKLTRTSEVTEALKIISTSNPK